MKLARFEHSGRVACGVVSGTDVFDLSALAAGATDSVLALFDAGAERIEAERARTPAVPLGSVRLLAPVKRPGKILGIGLNYRDHAAETGREPPSVQTWFNKQATSVNDPFGDVDLPAVSTALDYEVELVVVVGKHARHVPKERALEIVAGYMVGCDYSVRDWQRATPTMIMGKGFDTHAPAGPWMTTQDEAGDVASMGLRCLINGELRQNGRAGDMIFDIPAQIEHLTKSFTLEPGDLIFTGTPAGVGVAHTPPKFLKAGDDVRVEIDRLGAMSQRIVQETAVTRIG
jgi:2-keto-4-pentenoate hydratase/2-oxohepta-3-ene-1,7-dioic acid hydratase in catechol pathway